LRDSSSSSSRSWDGARRQNSCLYFSLAWQKQRWQAGHILLGSFGSWEHQAAPRASNSTRQLQHVAWWVSPGMTAALITASGCGALASAPRPPAGRVPGARRRGLHDARGKEPLAVGGVHGRGPQEALHLVAAQRAQERDHGLVLDALGHDLHA